MKPVLLKYHDFVIRLSQYCHSGQTGCVFFTSSDNRAGRVILDSGKITQIAYANLKGNDAVFAMTSISVLKYRLEKNDTLVAADASLPDTSVLLDSLKPNDDEDAATTSISSDTAKLIEDCLVDVIGPMASFVCEDHVHHAADENSALKAVMSELSKDEAEQFKGLYEQKRG